MNDNTILRIKVPAHLYESVKEQLTINEAKKSKHHYGAGMEVVKEKKMTVPKDGMTKVEEVDKVEETNQIQEKDKEMEKKHRSLDELKAAKEKLEARINEMEGMDKVEETENINEYIGMSPEEQQAMQILGSIIAGGAVTGALSVAAKNLLDKLKSKKSKAQA